MQHPAHTAFMPALIADRVRRLHLCEVRVEDGPGHAMKVVEKLKESLLPHEHSARSHEQVRR